MNKSIYRYLKLVDGEKIVDFEELTDVPQVISQLINDEFFGTNQYDKEILNETESVLKRIGYEWDPLSEPGYLRFRPGAVTVNEVAQQHAWKLASSFGKKNTFPVYRIDGGELYSLRNLDIRRHTELAKDVGMYGQTMYQVDTMDEQILRFSACCNKLGVAQSLELTEKGLPLGLFEISKSYRYEEEERLRLGERCRCFRLPEMHILNKDMHSALDLIVKANKEISERINDAAYEYVILCSVTEMFLREHFDFIRQIACTSKFPMLICLALDTDETCENGVQLDLEYKVLTSYGGFLEIATLQLDDGSTDFSYGITYKDSKTKKTYPVYTIHAVFCASVERFVFSVAERAVCKKTNLSHYYLPFEYSPIQCRIITEGDYDFSRYENRLQKLDIRYDIDDRKLSLLEKKDMPDLQLIPYLIIVGTSESFYDAINDKYLDENEFWSAIERMRVNGSVPSYSPVLLSQGVR